MSPEINSERQKILSNLIPFNNIEYGRQRWAIAAFVGAVAGWDAGVLIGQTITPSNPVYAGIRVIIMALGAAAGTFIAAKTINRLT